MRVSYITKEKIVSLNLPQRVWGNYWITDSDEEDQGQNIINIKAHEGKWEMTSNSESSIIYNNVGTPSVILDYYTFYTIKERLKDDLTFIYVSPVDDQSFTTYEITGDCVLKIGRGGDSDIIYNNLNIGETNNELVYQGKTWIIKDLNSRFGTYVNNERVATKLISNGDVIFIMGLKIIIIGTQVIINNPMKSVKANTHYLVSRSLTEQKITRPVVTDLDPGVVEVYEAEDYFLRSPRFRSNVMVGEIKIDNPPNKKETKDPPAILAIGPSLLFGMASLTQFFPALQRMQAGDPVSSYLPNLFMSFSMFGGSLLWPLIQRRYQKKEEKKYDRLRNIKYKQYVDRKKRQLQLIGASQRDSLLDNNVSLSECQQIVMSKNRRLWERDLTHDDFLKVRLGIGNTNIQIKMNFQEQEFSMDDDNLKSYLNDMINETRLLYDVPITESFVEKNVLAIEGKKGQTIEFVNNLILQFITFHSYKDLKIMVMTSEVNKNNWEFTKILPHSWDDRHKMRFFASNSDEMKELSFYLEQEMKKRRPLDNEGKLKVNDSEKASLYMQHRPYYMIITDNYKTARNLQIIDDIVNGPYNFGFSLLIIGPNLSNVPAKCKAFISLGDKTSGLFESELISNKQKIFAQDKENYDLNECARVLANIPLEMSSDEYSLPDMISFLQMYKVGMIDQLNPLSRWKKNNPVVSLSVPVGIGTNGELFKLDLHEKFHGPHGLIAGMTGSGKSEFIISYVLSLAVNFSPDEVQFVLIDYKGGGLTGAFENREAGLRLPHVIGTITNLDVSEINRSLLSVQSELKRRQREFSKAREMLRESTMDIYKYQKYYRDGMIEKPISHLFLISDEFAELKVQQPEFMDELISTARIGRALGVHLILATQKPAGVVNDQIWSNTRFRVCLKVQSAADSKDMIRRPDAASLKQAGRFFLQVGYDEFFALGQSAYSGSQYIPSERVTKQIDDSVSFIDQMGNVIKSVNNNIIKKAKSQGEELSNIVKFVTEVCDLENMHPTKLWLDRIPNEIFLDDLKKKYNYQKVDKNINPVIGEYDLPAFQKQDILTVPLTERGNTYIIGITGKELFYRSLIYSTSVTYSPNEVNMYILDFDTESLKMFNDMPQVGDIMVSNEPEKIENFFKMINKIIASRKEKLKSYNGDYKFFLSQSDEPMPLVLIMINSFEAFLELYPNYEDLIISLSRDCTKYGVVFVIGGNAENALRMKARQNFVLRFALELNDPLDYRSFLGTKNKFSPSSGLGRGLIGVEDVSYEFQTTKFSTDEKINDVVFTTIKNEKAKYGDLRAKRVPTLPNIVRLNELEATYDNISKVPIGMETESLDIAYFDFTNTLFSSIVSEFAENEQDFIKTLFMGIEKIPNISIQFWDAGGLFKDVIPETYYVNKNFDSIIKQLHPFIIQQANTLSKAEEGTNPLKDQPIILIFVNDFGSIYNGITDKEEKGKVNELLAYANKTKTLFFVLVDSIGNLKKVKFDDWYQAFIDNTEGLYIGSNIDDSNYYRLSMSPRSLRDPLPNDYGYIIKKGIPTRVKYISSREEKEDE